MDTEYKKTDRLHFFRTCSFHFFSFSFYFLVTLRFRLMGFILSMSVTKIDIWLWHFFSSCFSSSVQNGNVARKKRRRKILKWKWECFFDWKSFFFHSFFAVWLKESRWHQKNIAQHKVNWVKKNSMDENGYVKKVEHFAVSENVVTRLLVLFVSFRRCNMADQFS